MHDNTPQDRYEYLGDADGAAGGASSFFEDVDEAEPENSQHLDLRELSLEELVRMALAEAEAALPAWKTVEGAWRRQAHALDDSMPGEEVIPVRLRDGSSAWLELNDRVPKIFAEPVRSDRVILAALCAAGTTPVDHTARGDAERLWRAARAYVLLDGAGLAEPFDLDLILRAVGNNPRIGSIKPNELFDAWKLRVHDALIRHYRADYAALEEEERITELVEVAGRMDKVLVGLKELQGVLEEGGAAGLSRHRPRGDRYKGADPQRDVTAAALRDALMLKHREIAAFLEFSLPDDFQITGKIPAVKSAIERGRALLRQALADTNEYEHYMEQIRPELKDWHDYISSWPSHG